MIGGNKSRGPGQLDNVESKVLLRTVNSSSTPEFGSGLSEEQLPLLVFVRHAGQMCGTRENSTSTDATVVAHVVA